MVCGFNEACKISVLRYADVWKKFIPRIGRWVDMEDDYKTMDPHYMESIWWVFKSLFDKGLIYEGYKAMHICPRCESTLSNFEVTQNYKDVKDISVTAKFELVDEPGTYILAWTTTPWTFPGNVALAVGADIDYVKFKRFVGWNEKGKANYDKVILAKVIFDNLKNDPALIKAEPFHFLFQVTPEGYDGPIDFSNNVEEFKGSKLVGKKYRPLFSYFENKFDRLATPLMSKSYPGAPTPTLKRTKEQEVYNNIYTIQIADFVTTEDGTGVVHIAPGFGEDDLNLGREKNLPTIIHVTPEGKFTAEVKDLVGLPVKPINDPQATDKKIVEYLKSKGLAFASEEFTHSYPHCWRCDTPLLKLRDIIVVC